MPLVHITKKCKVSPDGITVISYNVDDEPNLTEDLAKIVVESMKKGRYVERSQPMAPETKVLVAPIQKEVEKAIEQEPLTVYQFAKVINIKWKRIRDAAKKLGISASHGNSALTPAEMDRIKAAL